MRGLWKFLRGVSDLEGELRAGRPRPRQAFVSSVAESLAGSPAPRRRGSRAAFAAALSVFMLGALASFGGASYAASGASHAFHAAKRVTATSHPRVRSLSAASDEYSATQGGVKAAVSASKPKLKPKKPSSTSPPPATVPSGQLPFTGLSLAGTSLLGFGLIGLGVALRRRERRENL